MSTSERWTQSMDLGLVCLLMSLLSLYFAHGQSILGQNCEQVVNGEINYYACTGQSETLLYSNNTKFTLRVEPENVTCGLGSRQEFCTQGITQCLFCDSSNASEAHPPEYMVDFMMVGQGGVDMITADTRTAWQSVTRDVISDLKFNITLLFQHTYSLQNLRFTFDTSRPEDAILYKTLDYGVTWEPWQYYSADCSKYANVSKSESDITITNPGVVICTTKYSNRQKYKGGNLDLDVLNYRFVMFAGEEFDNFRSLAEAMDQTDLPDFLQFNGLRLEVIHENDNSDSGFQRLQSYSGISNIQVDAICVCNLHASYCTLDPTTLETTCLCMHNTMGKDCEMCLPLYNEKPWRRGRNSPYQTGTANQCEKCECNNHAVKCHYDADKGHGVCDNCTHNTTGVRCEDCLEGFFHNAPLNHTDTCAECACEIMGVKDGNMSCEDPDGQCSCKDGVGGLRCDTCADGTYGLLLEPAGTCKPCECEADGSVMESNICDKETGQCPCKTNVCGVKCTECCEGFYRFPVNSVNQDCINCACNAGGSLSLECDRISGNCPCKPFLKGKQCHIADSNRYTPDLDRIQLQPTAAGSCTLSSALLQDRQYTGRVYAECGSGKISVFGDLDGGYLLQPAVEWDYRIALRYTLQTSLPLVVLQMMVRGSSNAENLSRYQPLTGNSCPQNDGTEAFRESINDLTPGTEVSWVSPTKVKLDARCVYQATLQLGTTGQADTLLLVDSLVVLPAEESSLVYNISDNATRAEYDLCQKKISSLSDRASALTDPLCITYSTAVMNEMAGEALACDCDTNGTQPDTQCYPYGGQCNCKPGAYGRRCEMCEPGYYNHTSNGCTACDCVMSGSSSAVCNYDSGQCDCLTNVATANQENALGVTGDLRCSACLKEYFGHNTGQGCEACDCDPRGSNSSQCDDFGKCECNFTINGQKCDECVEGYYGHSQDGCSECNCFLPGSTGIACSDQTGNCGCKSKVVGDKCDRCNATSFNLDAENPDGCQTCFCFGHGVQCTSASGFAELVLTEDEAANWNKTQLYGHTFFVAPEKFLGNKLASYGKVISMSAASRELLPIDFTGHKVAVLQGNGESVYYDLSNRSATLTRQSIEMRFLENEWHYNQTLQPDTPSFYGILADLTGIFLQHTFNTQTLDIFDVSMIATKQAADGEVEVGWVENCTCSTTGTAGLSCEKCAQGFRRMLPDDNSYTACTPCDCNQRGETDPPICDEATGECLNCKNGTEGANCDLCSSNVRCDGATIECQDNNWGISRNGCVPCDCDSVGSVPGNICDKITGQCVCKDHVTGRRCDECEDNYFNLTANGCTECSECYSLVMDEMTVLRAMRDNLTSLVLMMQADEERTEDLGPFSDRLKATVLSMNQLNVFLEDAQTVNETSGAQILQFDSTLQNLTHTLNTTISNYLQDVNSSIGIMDSTIAKGDVLIAEAANFTRKAHFVLNDKIPGYTAEMEELKASLEAINLALSDVSDESLQNVLKVTAVVGDIRDDSTKARADSEAMLKETQLLQSTHATNIQECNALENYVATLSLISSTTLTKSGELVQKAADVKTHASNTRQNASSVGDITTDIASLNNLALRQTQEAAALYTKGQDSSTAAQATIAKVDSAETTTAGLVAEVRSLQSRTAALVTSVDNAYNSSQTSSQQANDTVNLATNMLDIMENFDARATAVETEAKQYLDQVQDIRNQSETAIASAASIKAELLPAKQLANESINIASAAKDNAAANLAEITAVKDQAQIVNTDTTSSLNDVQMKNNQVLNINNTMVTPSQTVLTTAEANVQALVDKSDAAKYRVQNASANVTSTKERIAKLVEKYNSIPRVDSTRTQQLRALVQQARQDFDSRDLKTEVQRLKTELDGSMVQIAQMQARVDTLKFQIARLRNVGAVLRTSGKK